MWYIKAFGLGGYHLCTTLESGITNTCSCLPLYKHCIALCTCLFLSCTLYRSLALCVCILLCMSYQVTVSTLLTTVGQGTWVAAEESVGAEPNDAPTDTDEVWLLNSSLPFLITLCSFYIYNYVNDLRTFCCTFSLYVRILHEHKYVIFYATPQPSHCYYCTITKDILQHEGKAGTPDYQVYVLYVCMLTSLSYRGALSMWCTYVYLHMYSWDILSLVSFHSHTWTTLIEVTQKIDAFSMPVSI